MAKFTTKGIAKREVECDAVEIRLAFTSRKRQSREALKEAISQCDDFLAKLKEYGFELDAVKADTNDINKNMYDEEQFSITTRAIKFKTAYDLKLIDFIMATARDDSYSVNLSMTPYISERNRVHDELRKEATADARRQADQMAEATGMKVAGIERIKTDDYYDYVFGDGDDEAVMLKNMRTEGALMDGAQAYTLYTEIGKPVSIEEESVYIEWVLE